VTTKQQTALRWIGPVVPTVFALIGVAVAWGFLQSRVSNNCDDIVRVEMAHNRDIAALRAQYQRDVDRLEGKLDAIYGAVMNLKKQEG
jgi:hypothetical protein